MTRAAGDPWWASDAVAGPEPADDEGASDPVDAHRAARRSAPSDEEAVHDVDVCGVCPICVALRALGDTRPELLAHLTEAGRHLAAAARTLLEEHVSGDGTSAPEGDGAGHDRVTRIDLD